ncbi:MAG: hypothetical protein J3Q66DRAFT_322441 [Benniella sp.]|nr:MAG: hypothetical protein J3Q66DRAFT_322441 [Benniella sp.]
MSDEKHNQMGEVMPADEECIEVFDHIKQTVRSEIHRINKEDDIHGLHEMDKLKRISEYTPVLYAKEEVAFGTNYFAKIHLGDEKYIHVRAHKSTEGKVNYHSMYTEPDGAIWELSTPLKYFTD